MFPIFTRVKTESLLSSAALQIHVVPTCTDVSDQPSFLSLTRLKQHAVAVCARVRSSRDDASSLTRAAQRPPSKSPS